jgi:regulator of replication initiation timing
MLLEVAKSDPIAKVVGAIDELVAKLKLQQSDEVKQRDYCVSSLHENEAESARKYATKDSLEADIADLAARHDTLVEENKVLTVEIADLQGQQQAAGENRVKENKEFQSTMSDQTTTKSALEDAYGKLEEFYHKKGFLLQIKHKELPTTNALGEVESPKFKEYEANTGGGDAMSLIKTLIGEAQVLMDEATFNEQKAQEAYSAFLTETNASIKAKSKLLVDKTEELAENEETSNHKTVDRDQTFSAIEGLDDTSKDLHEECDFTLKNFTARQAARIAEMDALGDVKAILQGAK